MILLLLVIPQQPAIDEERGACDIIRVGGSEKRHRARDIGRLAETAQRDVFEERLRLRFIAELAALSNARAATRDSRDFSKK